MTEQQTATRATDKRWYVIHTYSGYENKVKANLEHRIESMGMEDKIFQVLVPMEDEIEIRQGQRHTVQKKVYPGYVLVEMILDPESWFVVRNTPGVTSFVGSGNIPGMRSEPIPLDETEVKQILRHMGVETPKYRVGVHEGPERPGHGRAVRRVHRHGRRGQPGTQQVEGPREHLRPGDTGRARLPASRKAVTDQGATQHVAKKIRIVLTLQLPAGKATPAPPVGTALGPHGINIVEFTKAYNEKTADKSGQIIPAQITIFEDRSFTFVLKTPPAPDLLRKAAGIDKGSQTPRREIVGRVTRDQVRQIAEIKMTDLNANDIEAGMKVIEGTARSMGIEVVG